MNLISALNTIEGDFTEFLNILLNPPSKKVHLNKFYETLKLKTLTDITLKMKGTFEVKTLNTRIEMMR